ncbi:DUF3221 domain-containing protein [Peribacillus huizhouensis]|uniref:DUF3221 domain-containing protein n=1 Tax=Peribacillus huizhouensis TaxID=1501239 RepID=A0ABR6CWC7_9BACI|nr:DUF3221 domain-containing protein [Peribacillus huizhouensis]MBA9029329.1 hypothetical protein [Peribacillus huizhouensis]
MKKGKGFLIVSLIVLLMGCSLNGHTEKTDSNADTSDKASKEGLYVLSIGEQGMMVVNAIPSDFSSNGGEKEFFGAVSYHYPKASEELEVGQRVLVETDGPILESYPGQGKAKKVTVLPEYKPDKADLSESQVVRKALKELESESTSNWIAAIRNVTYDKEKDTWIVDIKQDESMYEFDIDDK